ncbi:unnamed protein product [Peronospora destructor]|uniref:Calponin-homology (CH) domain-containing protein n=1 Tax=Peronospora destructor TaxID=86335 RepID=A0AAV0U3C9_9STRA|nr:unnamed protein product [Peronospora destructor]
MEASSDVLATNRGDNMNKWTIDGIHRRRLSLLDKWASDKLMAIGYLRRQREVITWIESALKYELSSICLFEVLKSGVVLREMMELFFPDASNCMPPINRKFSDQMAPWKERENITVFLRLCQSIGMNGLSLFCTDDLYEGTDMVQVLFCLERFKMFLNDHTARHSKCVNTNEPTELSNQELEMSENKQIVTASKRLISSGSSSVLPEKVAINEKESVTREASELNSVLSKAKKHETVEPARVSDEKVIVEVLTRVCNQVPEDNPEVDYPADGDNVSFRMSGSDVSDEQQATEAGDTFVVMQISNSDLPLVLLGMKAKNGKTVARSMAKHDVPTIEKEYEALINEVVVAVEEAIRGTTTEPATDLIVDMKAENAEQLDCKSEVPAANLVSKGTAESENQNVVENEVTAGTEIPTADPGDGQIDSTSSEDVASAQFSAKNAEEAVAEQEYATPQPTEAELLDVKAMTKCSCGTCTIM